MLINSAEESYRKGRKALREGNHIEALAMFEAAVELERRLGHKKIQPRYLSYYGLCLGLHAGRQHEGVFFCREATTKESYNPELYLNLGRTLLAANRRREAYEALATGLRLQPEHPEILDAIQEMGKRRRPIIPFLDRRNRINVMLGRLRFRMSQTRER